MKFIICVVFFPLRTYNKLASIVSEETLTKVYKEIAKQQEIEKDKKKKEYKQ